MPQSRDVITHVYSGAHLIPSAKATIVLTIETQARLGFQRVPISMNGAEHAKRRGVRRLIQCNRRILVPAKTIRPDFSDKFFSRKIKLCILAYELCANIPAERRRRRIRPCGSHSGVREMMLFIEFAIREAGQPEIAIAVALGGGNRQGTMRLHGGRRGPVPAKPCVQITRAPGGVLFSGIGTQVQLVILEQPAESQGGGRIHLPANAPYRIREGGFAGLPLDGLQHTVIRAVARGDQPVDRPPLGVTHALQSVAEQARAGGELIARFD